MKRYALACACYDDLYNSKTSCAEDIQKDLSRNQCFSKEESGGGEICLRNNKRGKGSSVRILEDPLVKDATARRHFPGRTHGLRLRLKAELELRAWARPSCVICWIYFRYGSWPLSTSDMQLEALAPCQDLYVWGRYERSGGCIFSNNFLCPRWRHARLDKKRNCPSVLSYLTRASTIIQLQLPQTLFFSIFGGGLENGKIDSPLLSQEFFLSDSGSFFTTILDVGGRLFRPAKITLSPRQRIPWGTAGVKRIGIQFWHSLPEEAGRLSLESVFFSRSPFSCGGQAIRAGEMNSVHK